jgi:endonuclease G
VKHIQWRLVLLLSPLLAAGCTDSQPESDSYPHLRWGNPSGARDDAGDANNYLMRKAYYALSYNDSKGTPNWVSWRLVKEDLGDAPRFPFTPDPDLPPGFRRVVTKDYDGSGFDRGHMCPHGDRQSTEEASKATFTMTNIVPQSRANNANGWEQFESYCRALASRKDKELYIVAGPEGEGGTSRKGFAKVVHGKNADVVVPAKTWKVVMVLNRGGAPGADTRVIAVVMPNDETVDDDWAKYRTSVRSVEALTGYTFFDRVDPSVIGPLKEKTDAAPVPPPHDHGR